MRSILLSGELLGQAIVQIIIHLLNSYRMLEKVVKKRTLNDPGAAQRDLDYWLSKRPSERVAAVDFLRKQYYGRVPRLQRIARVVERAQR